MAGYTRQDTANNIANGNVIDADDLDSEFNAVEDAFQASSGHNHDGTAGEGAPITKVGPSQDIIVGTTTVLPKANNIIDLGSSAAQYKDGYFDGTVYSDTVNIGVNGYTTIEDNEYAVSTGSLNFDVAGDITLDADGGDILLQDGGTDFGKLTNNSNQLSIYSGTTESLRLNGADVDALGTLDVTGNTTVGGTMTITGDTSVSTGNLTVNTGNVSIGGTLGVTGTITGSLSGGVTGNVTGDLTGNVTGNADTATALQTARNIGGVSFDGTANINLPGVNTAGNQNTSGNAATATQLANSRTISLTGDVSGSASFNGSANATITATIADDSHNHTIANVDGLQSALNAKADDSTTISAGGGLTGGGNLGANRTISHADTSSQGSVNNSNGTVIQDITLDGYGHITNINSVNLDTRYYTESETSSLFTASSGDVMTGTLRFNDSVLCTFGNSNDFEIFHNGSHAYMDMVTGNLYIRDSSTTRFTFDDNGSFTASGNVTAYSDERLKSDIVTIPDALEKVKALRGVNFTKDGEASTGVIAQEVQQVIPEVVQENDEYLSVAYGNLVGILIEAVKELSAEVEALKAK